MHYRTLGKTGWEMSAISMGCWALGGQWGEIDKRQAIETVRAARDAGVNFFDTADAYGMGQSERYLGEAIRSERDQVYIATKVGNWGRRYEDPLNFNTVYSIYNCCDASLYRLGTDYIDLYQCHIPSPDRPELFVEAFERLVELGKIRHYAISTNDLEALKALNAHGNCASCQVNYSILNRSAEADILPYCREHNIGVLLRGPIAQGLLADKFTRESTFDDQVRQKWNPGGKKREEFAAQLDVVDELREMLAPGQSMSHLALQFTLAHPAVTAPIPGMKSPEQARDNAAAADGTLTEEQRSRIDELAPPATPVTG
jgi:aryl-alcohol dehydrogenase-like predicted oxidoreductase